MNISYFVPVVLCALAATASGLSKAERVHGENGWYIPQLDGTVEWIGMKEAEEYNQQSMQLIEGRLSLNPVDFYLYTQDNPKTEQIITASKKSIDGSNYDPKNATRICIHGWTSGKNEYINTGVRDAWLTKGAYNYIFVDWGRARLEYFTATCAVEGVGKKVAALIDFLVENYDLNLNSLEIIGHSLGAHVAGFAGKNIKSGQAHTIVGLDPALPFFDYKKPNKRLADTDGNLVVTIHTNGGGLGFEKPIGKSSFYVNGGVLQPGCERSAVLALLDILINICSHGRAIEYYVENIQSGAFSFQRCEKYEDAEAKKCDSALRSTEARALPESSTATGVFYVPVSSNPPYLK